MKKFWTVILFALANFGALALGGFLMGDGPQGEWYQELTKAPWTPPGWVFGAAWTSIMLCFTIYMVKLWEVTNQAKNLIFLFSVQWFLNVLWNPIFFSFHQVLAGLVLIILLTGLVWKFLIGYRAQMKLHTLWILPYAVWMIIATSLNAYVYIHN